MKTEKFVAKAGLFYVLSMLFGMCISWKYCGFELMCVACYYMVRALWNEIRSVLNDWKNMWNELTIRLYVAEPINLIINLNL